MASKYNIKIILNEIPKIELKNRQQYNNYLHYYSTYSAIKSNYCQGEIIYKIRSDLSINLNDIVNFFTDKTDSVKNQLTGNYDSVPKVQRDYKANGIGTIVVGDENYG